METLKYLFDSKFINNSSIRNLKKQSWTSKATGFYGSSFSLQTNAWLTTSRLRSSNSDSDFKCSMQTSEHLMITCSYTRSNHGRWLYCVFLINILLSFLNILISDKTCTHRNLVVQHPGLSMMSIERYCIEIEQNIWGWLQGWLWCGECIEPCMEGDRSHL